ncbi:MAG: ABC transporter permease [Lachnospiraceae bacterium]|nr:ABC transporter permease [Lachnospiraceae bacterium]
MGRLFCASLKRLWKNKCFWLCMLAMMVYILLYMWSRCRIVLDDLTDGERNLEDFYFEFAIAIGMLSAVFTTFFLSREYSDGTIRNKIIAGHTRKDIYLSHLAVTFFASLLMLLVGMAAALVGIPTLGVWKMGAGKFFLYLLITVMATLAFCAIYTLFNVLIQNKSFSAVITILAFFVLMLTVMKLDMKLAAPQTVFQDILVTGDKIDFREPMPNPSYVSGIKREIIDFSIDFLPAGQTYRVAYLWVEHPVRMLLSSVFLSVFLTALGIFFFERKDLK